MQSRDIAIAGCGPAGLAAALMLHRDGHRVTLFERFDAPRPVGSGLMIQPTGLAVLRSLELAEEVLSVGARIDRLFGQAVPSGRTVLDVRYDALGRHTRFGIGVHRAALFQILHRAVVGAGIVIATGRMVTASSLEQDGRRTLAFGDGRHAGPFDLVVDALGTASTLAPKTGRALAYGALWASLDWPQDAGFNPAVLEQRYVAASIMVGVLPIGVAPGSGRRRQAAFFWSLRQDRLDAWRQAGLPVWKEEVLRVWPATKPLLDQIDAEARLTFARYNHRTLAAPIEPALIHIGDAWHSASPQLGQGANMALLDAFALAKALRETGEVARALDRAVAMRRRHVRTYQVMTALFTPVYQSDSRVLPFVRDVIIGPLAKVWPAPPILAAMVSGLIGAPLRSLGLESPGQALVEAGKPSVLAPDARPLIVFDGECVLCSSSAQFVLRHDGARRFALTTAQGPLGQDLYRRLGWSADQFQTMLLVRDDVVLKESDAVLAIAGGLGWPWRAAAAFRVVPRVIRDGIYRIVARNRYRWFGRRTVCWRPTPDVADRIV